MLRAVVRLKCLWTALPKVQGLSQLLDAKSILSAAARPLKSKQRLQVMQISCATRKQMLSVCSAQSGWSYACSARTWAARHRALLLANNACTHGKRPRVARGLGGRLPDHLRPLLRGALHPLVEALLPARVLRLRLLPVRGRGLAGRAGGVRFGAFGPAVCARRLHGLLPARRAEPAQLLGGVCAAGEGGWPLRGGLGLLPRHRQRLHGRRGAEWRGGGVVE